MRFRILPLEERIVLDAAGGQEVLDSYNFEDPATGQDQTAVDEQAQAVEEVLSDQSLEGSEQEARVLVISSQLKDFQALAAAAASDVKVVIYDANNTSLQKLSEKIAAELGSVKAVSIAFANFGKNSEFSLTQGVTVTMESLQSSGELQAFWENITQLMKEGGRVDLLASGVAGSNEGVQFIQPLDGCLMAF